MCKLFTILLLSIDFYLLLPIFAHDRLIVWEPSIHDGARTETVSMLRNCSTKVIIAGHNAHHSPFMASFKNDPEVIFSSKHAPPPTHLPYGHSFVASGGIMSSKRIHHTEYMEHELIEDDIQRLYDFHQSNKDFDEVDAVMCSYPASYCEGFMALNKSLILLIGSSRYNLGRQCKLEKWLRWNQHIDMVLSQSKPKSFLIASNEYDAAYINYYTGFDPLLIEPTGFLYGALESKYNATASSRTEILLGPSQGVFLSSSDMTALLATTKANNIVLKHPNKLYGKYKLEQLSNHRAVVMFPLTVQSHFFVEVYAMGIPVFVPDPAFLIKLGTLEDNRVMKSCTSHDAHSHSSNTTSITPPKHEKSKENVNPESDDSGANLHWIQKSAYYRWPHVIKFSSWDHLVTLLNTTNYEQVHFAMMSDSHARFARSRELFSSLLGKLYDQGKMETPRGDYASVLQGLFAVSKLQVE